MVLNTFYSTVSSAVRTLPELVCFDWEAETGPPLTSVGLSVSCNRKWEKIERETGKKNRPLTVETLDNSSDCTCKYQKFRNTRVLISVWTHGPVRSKRMRCVNASPSAVVLEHTVSKRFYGLLKLVSMFVWVLCWFWLVSVALYWAGPCFVSRRERTSPES